MKVVHAILNGYTEDMVIPENDEERAYLEKHYLPSLSLSESFTFSRGIGQEVVDEYNEEKETKS